MLKIRSRKPEPDKTSDNFIVDRVISGQKEEFKQIVERYEGKLTRYAYSIIRDPDMASDVVQNTFIKAYVNLKSFDTNKKFSTWIYRIAHNEAINMIKKESKNIRPDDEEWFDRLPDTAEPISEKLDREFLKSTISKEFNKIPMKYKDPLMLYYIERQSYKQISEVLKLPVSTIGTRINRAKKMLGLLLSDKGIDYEQ